MSDTSSEISPVYEPSLIEEKLSRLWESLNLFTADPASNRPPYCIVMPPPNVTGVLHMGHALVNTLQDILIRWKRMSGFATLWVPGTDHAGIATQAVVERQLLTTTGKRRKDFSRDEFLQHVWTWQERSEATILKQLKRLGCSCDFTRVAFTMDTVRNRAVRTMFCKMYDAGLIYRGNYLVNWDPVTQTALADDEVEYEERASFLWHFRYPIEHSNGYLTIATTRPETLLGDTAVAVHPDDQRYAHLVGRHVLLPLAHRSIPIIADPVVDRGFGSGAVKVTPAHDRDDYAIAQRHNLPMVTIMTLDGKIDGAYGTFAGMNMEEARSAIVKEMERLGLLERIEPYHHRVGVSYRSHAIIEPLLSQQWFVRLSDFKQMLRDAVATKEVTLVPAHWESTYFHWIDHLRDWCISRQLWWGHRIPIWYNTTDSARVICYDGEGVPPAIAGEEHLWQQDTDVLDTWFSSALWPLSALGWPEHTSELKTFYPNATLVTGHDILFFWVARMILMGKYALQQAPFPRVFLHGLIYAKSYSSFDRDGNAVFIAGEEKRKYDLGEPLPAHVHSKWEKMSKSKGNIIDPIEVLETYGTDAMRMALAASATHAPQIDLDLRRFEEFKNFANKVWNGARFVFLHLQDLSTKSLHMGIDRQLLSLEDRWIFSLLARNIQAISTYLDSYAFDRAAMQAYEFFWKQFCAYYVELTKPVLFSKRGTAKEKENKQKILVVLLTSIVRLLHPMAPFITEELFTHLKARFTSLSSREIDDLYLKEMVIALESPACAVAPFPQILDPSAVDADCEAIFAQMEEIVHAVRNIRAEMQIPPHVKTDVYVVGNHEHYAMVCAQKYLPIFSGLIPCEHFCFLSEEPPLTFSATAVAGPIKLFVPLPQHMLDKEKIRLVKKKEQLALQYNQTQHRLANEEFLTKAPLPQIAELRKRLESIQIELLAVTDKLDCIK